MSLDASEIVLGLGGTVDYEVVWDQETIQNLVSREEITSRDLTDFEEITTYRELIVSMLNFLAGGDGGERFVADPSIIFQFSREVPFRTTLGGTPVRAAMAMDVRGLASTVHLVSTNQETRDLLPATTQIFSSAEKDTLYPHLIIQFPAGARISLPDGELESSRANRVIYTHDPDNEALRISPELGKRLSAAKIFLISGLNIFHEVSELSQRLNELSEHMASLADDAVVIFEDAGYHVRSLADCVHAAIVPRVDVYSMNEDEAQGYVGREVSLHDGLAVANLFRDLREKFPVPALLVHTHLWAAIVGPQASGYRGALEAAVVGASARFLHGDELKASDFVDLGALPRRSDVGRVEAALIQEFSDEVIFVPGFELTTTTPTTIGLGDSFIGGFIGQLSIEIGGIR